MVVLNNTNGKQMKVLYSIVFAISAAAYSLFVSMSEDIVINVVQAVICGIALFVLNYKFSFFEKTIKESKLVTTFVAVSFIVVFLEEIGDYSLLNNGFLGCAIIAIPFLFAIFTYTIYFAKKLFFEFFTNHKERVYFVIIIFLAFFIAIIIGLQTELFYGYKTDIVYGSDCRLYFQREWDIWINGSIVRPSTSIANFPATFVSKIISYVFYFIPNIYPISCMALQLFEVLMVGWMIAKLLKLNFVQSILFQWTFVMGASILVFSLAVERYIPTLFLLALAIVVIVKNTENKRFMIAFAGMPLFVNWGMGIFSYEEKSNINFGERVKEFIIGGIKTVGWMLLILTVNGRIMLLNPQGMLRDVMWYSTYSGSSRKLPFDEQVRQFLQTVEYMFIHPQLYIDANDTIRLPRTETWSVIGLLILLICVIVFILYRKEKLVQVSMWTVVLCVVIHMIIGLGAVAYEMFLYSSLYTWAFLVLIFRGIRGLIEKFGKNKQEKYTTIALGIMLALLLFNNIPWFIEIISYGINTYPVISAGI